MRKLILILSMLVMLAPILAVDVARGAGSEYLVLPFEAGPSSWTADWYDAVLGGRNRITQISDGVSGKAINVSVPAGSHFGTAAHYRFGDQGLSDPDELYYRYFIRLPTSFKNYGKGKIPGPAGLYTSSGRNGLRPTDSNPGWSARMQFSPSTTPVRSNTTALGFYVYHRDQAGSTGDSFVWDASAGLLTHGTWHCVEGHVSMNSPGVKNGILEGWVDDQLAFYKDDFRFLGSADAVLGVKSFWFDTYYGGTASAPGPLNFQFDELVLSPERIGCGTVAAPRFTDTGDSVHRSDIERLAFAGITYGCNPPANDKYCPKAPVSRGAMAAFLTRALDLPPPDVVNRFVDDDDTVFADSIDRLASSGVTYGCNPPTNDRFCPARSVTRGQMAAFLTRAVPFPAPTVLDRFVDDDSSEFESAIDRLASSGVTLGCNPPTNDRYCPAAPVTRAQMATFLTRALNLPAPPPTETEPPFIPTVPKGYDAVVPVGWSIQAVANSQPPGAAIFLEAGVHQVQTVVPKAGQSFTGATGAKLDGQGVQDSAFSGFAPNVSVTGLEIYNYSRAFVVYGDGWTLTDVSAHDNGLAFQTTGDDVTVSGSQFVNQQQEAVLVTGSARFRIEDSRIERANQRKLTTYSAGIKLIGTTDATVTGSTLDDNYGYGLWFTSAFLRTVVTDNTVTDNLRPGIVHDYAYVSTIADNVVTGNGREPTITDWLGAGILIFGPDATVTGNTVAGNRDGIALVTHSGSLDGPRGLYIPSGAVIEGNQILQSGLNGLSSGNAPASVVNQTPRPFQNNKYVYSDAGGKFWGWASSKLTWGQWQTDGHDLTGSFTVQ